MIKNQLCPHCGHRIPMGQAAKEGHLFYKHDYTLEDPEWLAVGDPWDVVTYE